MPTQRSPGATGDEDIAFIVPPATGDWSAADAAPGAAARPAARPATPRSGEIRRQCMPPSVVDITYWKPANNSCGLVALKISGFSWFHRRPRGVSTFGEMLLQCS